MKHYFLALTCLCLISCGGGSSSSDSNNSDTEVTDNPTVKTARTWSSSGGNATISGSSGKPFLQFIPDLSLSELSDVSRGRELFVAQWEAAVSSRPNIDGLGPLFIADACSSCHVENGRAVSLNADGSTGVGILFRLGDSSGNTDATYGGQLQSAATSGQAEGSVSWQQAGDNILFSAAMNTGALQSGIKLAPRLSPQLVGMGLLDLIPQATIEGFADPNDSDQDGISGRVHWIEINGQQRIGRFGWKAINVSLAHQAAGALNGDMGLTSPLQPNENCTFSQTICATQPSGGFPEVSNSSLDAIETFMIALGVPARRISDQAQFDRGADLFEQTGCQSCHKAQMSTGTSMKFNLLSNQVIYPYTDLLLHDMGESLSDGVKELNAMPREWRTPPLWGIGLS